MSIFKIEPVNFSEVTSLPMRRGGPDQIILDLA